MLRETEADLEMFDIGSENLPAALKSMGYDSLRPGQQEPIDSVLMGRDTFCIMPTGQGKTLTFLAPIKAMGWKTVVFSPLIALMKDQVEAANKKRVKASSICSANVEAMNAMAIENWVNGSLDMLYVAPERMRDPKFEAAMNARPPQFVVVDEAHTISQWSSSFRPDYAKCGTFIDKYSPRVVMALTATATKSIIDDVKRVLGIPGMAICRYYVPRTNLKLSSKYIEKESDIAGNVRDAVRSVAGSCIVYVPTVKDTYDLSEYLNQIGEEATYYNGQMGSVEERDSNMRSFMEGRSRIVVATNAFGMGIDKPDIEAIVHTAPPNSIEAIAQETGRAARDGRDAICPMFWSRDGLALQDYFYTMANPNPDTIRKAYNILLARADENGVARVLVKDIVAAVGDSVGAESACNYLETLGCVERSYDNSKVFVVEAANEFDELKEKKRTGATYYGVMEAISTFGKKVGGEGANGGTLYKIDLEMVASHITRGIDSVKRYMSELSKTGFLTVVQRPFSGKVTRILRDLDEEDLIAAEIRARLERDKVMDVRKYLKVPDAEKHDYMLRYFSV